MQFLRSLSLLYILMLIKKVLGFSYGDVHTLKEECEATIPRNQTCEVVISLRAKEVSE